MNEYFVIIVADWTSEQGVLHSGEQSIKASKTYPTNEEIAETIKKYRAVYARVEKRYTFI